MPHVSIYLEMKSAFYSLRENQITTKLLKSHVYAPKARMENLGICTKRFHEIS